MIETNVSAAETAHSSGERRGRRDTTFLINETHTMIDIRKLKELVRLMVENELTEIDLHDQQETVTIKRGTEQGAIMQQPFVYGGGAAVAAPATAGSGGDPGGETYQKAIESPMVGTFYTKPTPDAKAFVSVGDSVGPDTVVCLVEAMKVFNEIKAEQSGVVERILVNDGDAVEFGQALIVLK